jgi:hypothetical protein
MQTDPILVAFHRHEHAGDGASLSLHDQGRHCGMEEDAVRHAAAKHFCHPAVIVRTHCDEVGLDRSGAVENEGRRVLDFAHRSDGGSLSRQQRAATLYSLVTGINQGLAEFVVPLQIDCSGYDGGLEHAKIHAMNEDDVVRSVE